MRLSQRQRATTTTGHHARRLSAVALALAALQGPAWAVEYSWRDAVGGVWDDASLWTQLGVPGSGDGATINGTGVGSVLVRDLRSVGRLTINGGVLDSSSVLTVGDLRLLGGALGVVAPAATGGVTVTGSASFEGTRSLGLASSVTLTLLDRSNWSAGNGSLGGVSSRDGQVLNRPGARFVDDGAASATGSKSIMSTFGGGSFVNGGTYDRNGLGTTLVYGFNNTGTLNINGGSFRLANSGQSSGTINVAAGARLFLDSANDGAPALGTIAGTVNNVGLVELGRGSYTFAPTLAIGGAVSLLNDGTLTNQSTNTLSSLTIAASSGTGLAGAGHLTTAGFSFVSGLLGGTSASAPAGRTTVTGLAAFDGARIQAIGFNHTLTLQGTSTWSAGDGGINGAAVGSLVRNAAGASFTDAGAASAAGIKTLVGAVGGSFVNDGSYVRNGLGTTRAYGFSNGGTLDIVSGTFAAISGFANTGSVRLATGAVLAGQFSNAGLITGTGTVRTGSNTLALVNAGTLDPGSSAGLGTLTVDGDLTLATASVLRIDLGSAGVSDRLAVTDDALLRGELAIWGGADTVLTLGTAYTIASFNQRLSASTFDSISWHGLSADQFAVEYGANSVVLRVTAVPEPGTWALWACGLALGGWRARALRVRTA